MSCCFAADESNDISARRYINLIKGRSAPYVQCPCRHSRPVKVPCSACWAVKYPLAAAAHKRYMRPPGGFCDCSLICAPRTEPHTRHSTTHHAPRTTSLLSLRVARLVSYGGVACNGLSDICNTSRSHMAWGSSTVISPHRLVVRPQAGPLMNPTGRSNTSHSQEL